MTTKNILYTALLSVATLGMVACSDSGLDPVDYSEINTSNFPKTKDDVQALVMSCYYPLRSAWGDGIFTTSERGVMFINDCTTGILTGTYGPQQMAAQMNYFPTTNDITLFYASNTDGSSTGFANKVSRCTLVLDKVEKAPISDADKLFFEAEVRCARGFLSYLLYDMFGPIVVAPLDVLQNPLNEAPLPRLSRAEMVKFIEDDLLFAADNLPMPQKTEYGRFSRGLAKMLLIRLYLHETADYNYPEGMTQGNKDYFNKVESLCRELMSSDYGYQLQSDYPKMFEIGGQGSTNKELIYSIPCKNEADSPSQNQWHVEALPTNFNQGGMGSGYQVVSSTWYFYDSFEAADTRKTWLLPEYTNTDGETVTRETPQSPIALGPIPLKYGYDPEMKAHGNLTNCDQPIFRYADVYLSLAEALTMKQGSTEADKQEAVRLVNVIRHRAHLGDLPAEDYASQDKLLDAILMERYHEFWCENGQFRADLIRYHKLVPLVKKINGANQFAEDYKELFPLPLYVISDGKGQVVQNKGYD